MDAQGNQTRYFYDSLGRRVKTIANYVTGVYNPSRPDLDLTSTTTYDLAGRVIMTTDTRGTQTTFTYDAAGRRLKVTQAANTPLASTFYTCYDKGGRVLRVIQNYLYDPTQPSPDAQDTQGNWRFTPNTYGRNNDRNLVTTYTLDKAGRQTQVTRPLESVRGNLVSAFTSMTYYKDGQLESMADLGGDTAKYRYDGLRRRVLIVNSYNESEDPAGWHWNSAAAQWQKIAGDPVPLNMQGQPNSRNLIAQVSYDKAGRVLSQRDPNGHLTQYSYDQLNRRTQLTNPLNQTWQTGYSNLSGGQTRLILTNPGSTPTSAQQTFDRAGRLASVQYLNEGTKVTPDLTFTYDKLGNRRTMVEKNGTTTVRGTTYTFDSARRLTSVGFDNNGDGSVDQTVSYAYDAGGLRTQLTLPGNLTLTYSYDARGQLTSLTDWSSQAVRYAYDSVGRLGSIERTSGLRSLYQYDAAGRLTLLRHTLGRKTLGHFAYDPGKRGNRLKLFEGIPHPSAGTTTLDSAHAAVEYYVGSWSAANGFNGSLNFSAALRVAFMGDQATLNLGVGPDHGICDIYIDDALWQSIDSYAATATDTPQAISVQLSNEGPHLLEIRNRAEKNRAASGYKVRFYSLVIPRLYDLHTVNFLRNNETFDSYDGQARVWFADYFAGANLQGTPYLKYEYAYDPVGNRTQQTKYVVGGTPYKTLSTFSYDAANRMTTDQVQTYDANNTLLSNTTKTLTYDAVGRMTSDGTNGYAYDAADRLLSVNNTAYQYAYNGAGQRVQQTVSGTITQYLLDVQPGLWKVLSATSGANTTRYVHGPAGIQAHQQPDSTWRWQLQDGLGSVRAETDATFALLGDRGYEPYGAVDNTQGTLTTPFGFTGEATDGDGLLYLRARYYNPALGVFPNLDPLEGDIGRVLSLNRYAYVQGNVVNNADPLGLCPQNPAWYDAVGQRCVWLANELHQKYGWPLTDLMSKDVFQLEIAYAAGNANSTFNESDWSKTVRGNPSTTALVFAGAILLAPAILTVGAVVALPVIVGVAVGGTSGITAGTAYGEAMYAIASSGQCGCEKKQQVTSIGKDTFVRKAQEQAAYSGAVYGGVISTGIMGKILVGGTSILQGAVGLDIARRDVSSNKLNVCNVIDGLLSAAGILGGVSLANNGLNQFFSLQQAAHTPQGPLPPGWTKDWTSGYGTRSAGYDARWFDPNGGEWRWQMPDEYHPLGHWDYNPWEHQSSPWTNIYPWDDTDIMPNPPGQNR